MKILELLKTLNLDSEYVGEDVVADMYYKYRIVSLDKPIVITFPPNRNNINNDPNVSPFNFDFLCRYDVNILCFGVLGPHADNYFMHPDFSLFIEKLGVALKPFKMRLGYANSKGGFGIGAYAEALNLDHAILFHPVSTKKSNLVPWDTRPTTKAAAHIDWSSKYSDVNIGNCKGYIIYDPDNEIDVKHAVRFHGLKHIKINGFGHGSGYYFLARNSDVIKDMIKDFLYTQEINMLNVRNKSKLLRFTSTYYDVLLSKKPNNPILIKNQKKLKVFFNSPLIKSPNTISTSEFEDIRDAAIALEDVDIQKAMNLMKIAFRIRPTGPLIKRKMAEYQKKLKVNILEVVHLFSLYYLFI